MVTVYIYNDEQTGEPMACVRFPKDAIPDEETVKKVCEILDNAQRSLWHERVENF